MDQQRLDYVLQQHENYVRTDGKAGELANLSHQNLSGCVIENRSMLTGLNLDYANLTRAKIYKCNLDGVSLTNSNCLSIHVVETLVAGANFEYANLLGAQILGCKQDELNWSEHYGRRDNKDPANFAHATLHQARIHMSDLAGANLQSAFMDGIYIRFVNLNGANLSFASMPRSTIRHANIKQANCSDLNAMHGDLCGAHFDRSNLAGSDFSYSHFGIADVGGVSSDSSFIEANLDRSDLNGTEFSNCDLSRSTFRNALLRRSKFDGCMLEGASFLNASYLSKTTFDGCGSLFEAYTTKQITTPASLDKINDALSAAGHREQVMFGLTGKLKLINYEWEANLYNPFPNKTTGRLYASFVRGKKPDSVNDVIRQENLGDYSISDVLFGIKWLINQSAHISE